MPKKRDSGTLGGWESPREMLTVKWAIIILVLAVIIVSALFMYTVMDNNTTMVDKIVALFNAVIMATLGYLFGYVPAKSSAESAVREKQMFMDKFESMDSAIDKYKKALKEKDDTIKDYETLMALMDQRSGG